MFLGVISALSRVSKVMLSFRGDRALTEMLGEAELYEGLN